ncbi:hypothetical protein AB3538_06150 [Acinetobacter baumannii]
MAKCERVLAMRSVPPFSEKSVEILGIESTYGEHAQTLNSREVVVKIAVNTCLKKHVCSLHLKLHKLRQVWLQPWQELLEVDQKHLQ